MQNIKMRNENLIRILIYICIVVVIIGGGLFIVKMFLSYYYQNQLLLNPCQRCLTQDPGFCGRVLINDTKINIPTNLTIK